MFIINEIRRLKEEFDNKISEKQMCLSFGDDFDSRFIFVRSNNWLFFFKENEKLYLVPVEWYRGCFQFHDIREVSDEDFEKFTYLKENYKQQIRLFDEIFEHPKFRLKTIFQ